MKFLIVLPFLVGVALAGQVSLSQNGGMYNFNYATGDAGGHTRSESKGADGTVSGSYSYVDPNGNLRQVSYTAGADGFKASGDTSVDKKTAADAAAIAALAPKAPEPVNHAAVHHYAGAPFHHYGFAHHPAVAFGHHGYAIHAPGFYQYAY